MGGPIPRDFVEAIRNAGDIGRLIADYVPLKQSGHRLRGLCPFHQEKTPSFHVDTERQLFYCFGCQTGGDVFKFVMLYEKLDFPAAAEMLAQRWGVELPKAGSPVDDLRARVLEMNRIAESFFRERLTDAASPCGDYLAGRGLEPETVSRLALGYAPKSWDALRGHLVSKRFRPSEIVKGGLALTRKSGQGEYDRFRDRLIFPIRDAAGRTVAFGGRAIGDDEPKYLNSPETPAYVKGNHLYGLDLAGAAIRREGFAVVVEGYMDLAALLQAGFENAVASLGTAFTPAQARLLARYTDRIVLSYDGDASGATATARSVDLLLERGFKVRAAEIPAGLDPDDFIRREGAEAYGKLLRSAPEYIEFLVRRESRSRNLDRVEEQLAVVNVVLPHLARLQSSIERATWAGRLADALRIEDELVLQELRTALKTAESRVRQRPSSGKTLPEAEARLLALLLASEEAREQVRRDMKAEDLTGTRVGPILSKIMEMANEGRPVAYPAVLDALDSDADRELLTRIAFRDEPEEGPSVADCLWTLKRRGLARKGREEAGKLAKLQQVGFAPDSAEVDDRLLRLQELAKQRDVLS